MSYFLCPVLLRPPLPNRNTSPTTKRLKEHKIADRTLSRVLAVLTFPLSRLRRNREQLFAKQLPRLLVHANHRTFWIKRSFVNVEYVLHCGEKIAVLFGRNLVAFFEVRLKFIFFRTERTVS